MWCGRAIVYTLYYWGGVSNREILNRSVSLYTTEVHFLGLVCVIKVVQSEEALSLWVLQTCLSLGTLSF